jgi:hypothetical protein
MKPVLKPGEAHNKYIKSNKKQESDMKILKSNLFRILAFVFVLAMFAVAAGAPEYIGTISH